MGGGWGRGGRLFEAGRLLTFSSFRMGAYSRWALIRGWALIRINTVTRKIKFFKNQVWLYFIRRIQPARPGYAGTTTNLQIDLNTKKNP